MEVHQALNYSGSITCEDPDGIVETACFVGPDAWGEHLDGAHRWVAEPLTDWLRERWDGSRFYGYDVEGADPRVAVVTRR